MSNREDIVAVGLFTAPEFARWGSKLRYVYRVESNDDFDDLLKAIDKADGARPALIKLKDPPS